MEGVRHSGRWNKKASFGTVLLMSMVIPTLTLSQPSEELNCPYGDYRAENGICCNKCSPGFKLVEMCQFEGHRSNCTRCPEGQFIAEMNFNPNCFRCKICKKSKHELNESLCESHKNTVCRCEDGYYKYVIDSETSECRRCKKCGPDEKENKCTADKNTVCECKENYYRDEGKCVPCKSCTSECKHLCPSVPTRSTAAPNPESGFLTNVIAGVVAVVIVLSVLVFLITYKTTKQLTKKKLLEMSSQPSDVSPDSLTVLIPNDEPTDKSLKAVPQCSVSEQESSNLPDCVPLEIKIPDLIYVVLDLVPVLQVKQLVRSLGVTDTVIERAELDHRSCQEAHYQMLKVWAQPGSRAGGGGQGGMMHRPLLLELIDKLREMNLGQAAEELETKYGIQ